MPARFGGISLGDVTARSARKPDYERECRALLALASAPAHSRDALLQKTADFAMDLCCAQTAGISLLERAGDENVFRWHTVAGRLAHLSGLTTPWRECPCAVVIEAGEPLLFTALATDFPALASACGGVHEALILPIVSGGRRLGAMWVASLEENCRFTREDQRVLTDLASVASGVLELVRAREHSRRETQRYSEVIAVLAHEFRNPLGPLENAIDAMQVVSEGREPLSAYLAVAQRQIRHLRTLMDELQDASRLDHNKLSIAPVETSLSEVLADALAAVEERRLERHHTLSLKVPPENLRLCADPVRLTQIIANLLSNAVRYTLPGGNIAVSVEHLVRNGEPHVAIVVRDNGIGISPASLPHIFEPFAQFARTHDGGKDGGLGIGLALAQRFAELHGGAVEIISKGVGQGTEARLTVPVRPGGAVGTVAQGPAAAQQMARRILLVDDNADARFALGGLLELEGHEVRVAADGPDALKILESWRPDLALIDIGMPGMDGYELATRIRSFADRPRLKLVALTGHVSSHDRTAATHAGFDAHLGKPVDIGQLRRLLAS
ncbi:ATP-binding protein [Paraburkholderia sp. CNPSo 3272]|uniref:hybrid sensor histidine kinase/response regulator n=1 Tax=Paraburkholderia sp. CNPSo 3272 TaxID=2940931 RepID=UPI0020B77682|nr:ATP-binding protein [Paraburkholderia sp. CNPSo 3272]MCP3727730.1 ATP-binding protein [Paraburkholderia sp. CNPSo 3272]